MKTRMTWMTGVLSAVLPIGLATLCLLPRDARAATNYWDFGGNPDTLWSTLANWDTAAGGGGGNPGSAPGASDTAVFNVSTLNSSAQTGTLSTALSVQGLVFNSSGSTKVLTDGIANRVLTLGVGGITVNAGAGAVTLGGTGNKARFNYILAGAQTWVNNGAGPLTISFGSTATLGIDNAGYLLTMDGSGDILASPSSTILSGAGGLTKNGTGTFSMGMNGSTFTGPLTLNAGTLNATTLANINTASSIGKGSAGGSAADLIFGGGTLKHDAANVASSDRLFTIGNANGLSATLDSSATLAANTVSLTGTGSLAFGGNGARTLTLTGINTGTNTFSPIIGNGAGGATALVKSGLGAWTLTGINTYTGGTTISAGTLKLNGSGTLGSSSGSLTLTGGTLDLGGANLSAGVMTVSGGGSIANGTLTATDYLLQGGMLQLDFSGASSPRTNILVTTEGLSLGNGAGLIMKGAAGLGSTQSFSSVTIGEGFSQIWNLPNGGSSVLALGTLTATTVGSGLFILGTNSGAVTTTSANDAAGILSGRIVYKDTTWLGANFATRTADGTIGANTNFIAIANGGNFTPVTGSNYTLLGDTTLNAGGSVNSLRVAPVQSVRAMAMGGNTLTIASGGVLLACDNNYGFTLRNGTLTAGSGNELIFSVYSRAPLYVSAQIADNGSPVAVTLVGTNSADPTAMPAALIVGTNNTYSGGTFINFGATLTAAYPQSLGTGFVKLNGGKLLLSVPLTISSNLVGSSGSLIDLGTNTLTVSQDGNSAFDGVLYNSGALIKEGGGVLTLSGTNTYAGGTTVEAGTLLVSNASGSGAGTNTVTVKNSATLGGTGSIAGTVTIENGGTLNAGSPGAVGTLTVGSLALSASSTFAVNVAGATSADRVVVTGSMTPAGALVVTPIGGYSAAPGTEWMIVTGTVSPGSFSSVTPGYQAVIGAGSIVLRRTGGSRGSIMIIR